jgi:DMSO/TMAO reductase YedYZ molybdopterin-dependent catalytic subunit
MNKTKVADIPASALPLTHEVEAAEFMGRKLTPVNQQNIASLKGPQYLDRNTYRLTIDGQVDHALSLSYADLQAYPQISRLAEMNCVEGWNFTAKFTGPTLSSILNDARIKPSARTVIFHTADAPEGFSSLDLDHIFKNDIILALKDNDLTLSADKGFPFQVVAMNNSKWTKWVTRIELTSNTDFQGYAKINDDNVHLCPCHPWWHWWPW